MNRRKFFQSIGAAVLGTAIALKIPDSLIPSIGIPELKKIPIPTFAQLNALYESCRQYGEEPTYIMFSRDMLEAVENYIDGKIITYKLDDRVGMSRDLNFYKFRNARLEAFSWYSDEMVSCGGGEKLGSQGRLNLITGKII